MVQGDRGGGVDDDAGGEYSKNTHTVLSKNKLTFPILIPTWRVSSTLSGGTIPQTGDIQYSWCLSLHHTSIIVRGLKVRIDWYNRQVIGRDAISIVSYPIHDITGSLINTVYPLQQHELLFGWILLLIE
jgi:hypothetical protein